MRVFCSPVSHGFVQWFCFFVHGFGFLLVFYSVFRGQQLETIVNSREKNHEFLVFKDG